LNGFRGSKREEMLSMTHVMRESWEIGTAWEADWSQDARSPMADSRI